MTPGFVRIIGGQWRGKRLAVPEIKDLRPTPDRVRETVFNWLAPYIVHSHCLDLFSGSGALGLEALSRGASEVVMVDQSIEVVALLQRTLAQWGASNASVYQAVLPQQLKAAQHQFDIVFIDPPYQANLLFPCCDYLEKNGFLADEAYIYLEARTLITASELPKGWHLLKNKKAGQVYYHLVKREKNHAS